MIYNSLKFITLFPVIFILYYCIPSKYNKSRNIYLLITSYLLYFSWKPSWALILLAITIVTYLFAIYIEKDKKNRKKNLVTSGIIISIIPLIIYKYYNFINTTFSNTLSDIGLPVNIPSLNWCIPIGISFFTFQAISYLCDVYYNKITSEKNFINYALYISFFPSIVSGPINKASLLLPQIKNARTYFDYQKSATGLKYLLWGMFLKVVIADNAGQFVNSIYEDYANNSGISCLYASIFYSIQIYSDFCGYTYMALGTGKLLGFELTQNFRRPYLSYSVTDFWHRWHISLSTWLKDYIYIPLGGNRCSRYRNYFNIFITFLVSGIWHGANWTFIVWGVLHGIAQIIEKVFGLQKNNSSSKFKLLIRITFTFIIINFAWIFFRMPTVDDAFNIIWKIITLDGGFHGTHPTRYIIIYAFILFFKDFTDEFYPSKIRLFSNSHIVIRWSTYIILILTIILGGVLDKGDFIYANF
jgi:D-alanyl-lipoteichoic acid acyltransferase DltB (MBOAT superfamily)